MSHTSRAIKATLCHLVAATLLQRAGGWQNGMCNLRSCLKTRDGTKGGIGTGRDRRQGMCMYPSDLTDAQWAKLEPLLKPPRLGRHGGGRPRK